MADFYYLMSSLPMLRFGEAPQLTRDELLATCVDKLSDKQYLILGHLALIPEETNSVDSVAVSDWNDWETCLRNRLAGRRKGSGHNAEEYLRHEHDFFSEIDAAIQEALALGNPLECERHLDVLRWGKLDDLASRDSFSFDALCIYMIKLLLLSKWQPRVREAGYENLDLILTGINDADSHGLVKSEQEDRV